MSFKKLRQEIVDCHNSYREIHSSPPLIYSVDLEGSAQSWAIRLSEWHMLAYSPESNIYGENVAEIRNPRLLKGSQIVDAWYKQEENYDYENFKHTGPIDQFAVMIWNDTKNIGVGLEESSDHRIFVVIHYSPPGLLADKFKENVRRPKTYTTPDKSKSSKVVPKTSGSCKILKQNDIKNFHEDTLKKINAFRTQHGSPPLVINDELCQSATSQAKFCATNDALMTQSAKPVGQTFLELLKPDFIITGGLAPRHWYAESIGYDYNKEPKTNLYNNFTQLIWKDSKEVGIGVAASLKGVLYMIGHFLPKGNTENKYLENVLTAKEKNQLCPCGCGYTAPACIQDLTTTILSKIPTNTSEMTKEVYTQRTLTVISVDQKNDTRQFALKTQEITVLREGSKYTEKTLRSQKENSELQKISKNTKNIETSMISATLPVPVSVMSSKNNALTKAQSKEYNLSQSKMSALPKPSLNLDFNKLKENLLQSHNKYRELHNVPPLEYSIDMENSAQNWSGTLAVVLMLTYSPDNLIYAENCAEVRNPFDFEAEEVTDLWYSQQKNYDYENFNHSGPVDQFCVMIWKESRKVGFGISISNDQRVFVVAHYSPPGLLSNYNINVLPPKGYKKPSIPTKPFVPIEVTGKSYKGIKKEELSEFHQDALGKLNNFRLRHNSPALKLNDNLCKSALDQAKRSATNQMLLTTNDPKYGETYLELTIQNFTITGGLASRHWYAESVGYVYNVEPKTDQYHNFTQLVWKNSKEMGIGVAASLQGVLYVIGHYIPPGNKINEYLENVPPSKEGNVFCACGCGYVAPACVKDLQTTIISKMPSILATEKSKRSKYGNSVRSFSIIDNSKALNRETKSKIQNQSTIDVSSKPPPSVISQSANIAKDGSSRVVMPSSRNKGPDSVVQSIVNKITDQTAQGNIPNRSKRSIIETTKSKDAETIIQKSFVSNQELQETVPANVSRVPTVSKSESKVVEKNSAQSKISESKTTAVKSTSQAGIKSITQADIKSISQAEIKPASRADIKPVSQATAKPTSQADIKPVSQATAKPTSHADIKPVSQATAKPTSQADIKPVSQATANPRSQADVKPVSQATANPRSQADIEPVSQATANSRSQATANSRSQATAKPTSQADINPVSQATANLRSQADVKPVSQATAKPTSQADFKPVSQATAKPISQADIKSVTQTTMKSTSQADSKSVSQVAAKPTSQATAKPTSQADINPVSQAMANLRSQAEVKPVSQATANPRSQATAKPISQADIKSVTQTTMKSTSQADIKPVSQATAKPTSQATAKPTSQADIKPVSQATAKPTSQATAKPTSQADIKPVSQATANPRSQADIEHVSQATANPRSQATANPRSQADVKPVSQATAKPTSQADIKPAS